MSPRAVDFDLDEWRSKPHHRKLEPLVKDWALGGFGSPEAIYLLYLVKLVVFAGGAALVISFTDGVGSLGDFSSWWTDPVVYQKFVVWTLLWEILGLGCGSMPLTFRFLPPIGGFLYWLRPGTMRLAPWPKRVPYTAGTTRTIADVGLYAAVLVVSVVLLGFTGAADGTLPSWGIWLLLVALVALGLRDKAPFLAARPEHYAVMLLIFLFPPTNMIFALKLVMLAMWWGAATSKLNRHFPFVVSVMISNTPWNRSKRAKRMLWENYPDDLRPSKLCRWAAHGGTVLEYVVPLVLIFARGGVISAVAVTIMVLFHTHIISTFPLAVPLEWNIFFIYSILFLFGHYGGVGAGSVDSAVLILLLVVILVGLPLIGNVRPDLVSFLPSMRYYAGNWATSVWLFRNDGAEDVFDSAVDKPAPVVIKQLTKLYDADTAELLLYKGLAFRAMHSHGRALNGLMCRAVDDLDQYTPREGELVAGVALGWNFGEGHLHDRQLLEAIQERCSFTSGRLRVITLESQPIQRAEQRYRILDAADGLLEEGLIEVDDMVTRQPWLSADDIAIPVEVLQNVDGFSGYTTPAEFAFLSERDKANWHGLDQNDEDADSTPAPTAPGAARRARPAPRPVVTVPDPAPVISIVAADPVVAVETSTPTIASSEPYEVVTPVAGNGHRPSPPVNGHPAPRPRPAADAGRHAVPSAAVETSDPVEPAVVAKPPRPRPAPRHARPDPS